MGSLKKYQGRVFQFQYTADLTEKKTYRWTKNNHLVTRTGPFLTPPRESPSSRRYSTRTSTESSPHQGPVAMLSGSSKAK